MPEKRELHREVIMSFLCSKLPIISNIYEVFQDLLATYIASITPDTSLVPRSGTTWGLLSALYSPMPLQLECSSYLSGYLIPWDVYPDFLKTDLRVPFPMLSQFLVVSSIIILILGYWNCWFICVSLHNTVSCLRCSTCFCHCTFILSNVWHITEIWSIGGSLSWLHVRIT